MFTIFKNCWWTLKMKEIHKRLLKLKRIYHFQQLKLRGLRNCEKYARCGQDNKNQKSSIEIIQLVRDVVLISMHALYIINHHYNNLIRITAWVFPPLLCYAWVLSMSENTNSLTLNPDNRAFLWQLIIFTGSVKNFQRGQHQKRFFTHKKKYHEIMKNSYFKSRNYSEIHGQTMQSLA